jgi:tetratricopeptide (TPR) repeat protein
MKLIAGMLLIFFMASAVGDDLSKEIKNASENKLLNQTFDYYAQGKYNATVEELKEIEKRHLQLNKETLGLISYWKGICYNRMQEYDQAIKSFKESLRVEFIPEDLHYEFGQALFAAEQLQEARLQFRESLKRRFKRGVSLYYIAYISHELGDNKKAVTFYKAIDKLDAEEAQEVKQAAEMQIGDIYLEQVEKHPDSFRAVEKYVIPQYQLALEVDPTSNLAPEIQKKITTLQHKYDLVLFGLINGRPTVIPPYFLRGAAEVGYDSNVTFAPQETTIAESDQGSLYSKLDFLGRYTFYHRNYLSIAPEMRFNTTYYFNREPEIYRNDNYLIAPAIRLAYESFLWKKPASTLFDYEYAYTARDINAKNKLEFSGRSHTLMLGERVNYFDFGESIFRLRHRIFQSYVSSSDSKTTSLVFEQIKTYVRHTLLFFASYDMTRVNNDIFDTNALTLRADFIFPRIRDWFTPSIGLGVTTTDPVNDRENRGREWLLNPSLRLSKTFGKNWRTNFKFDYQKNESEDKANFAFKKYTTALDLEYIF